MVSVIIVHYQVKKELFACIASILKSPPKGKYEIIVVDNDEAKNIKTDLLQKFPQVIYIPNENKGFGQANNRGAAYAKGEYLFFLNPDTTLEHKCLTLLAAYLYKHTEVSVVAPLLYDNKKQMISLQGAHELTPLRAIFSFSFLTKLFPHNPITKKYWMLDEWDRKIPYQVSSVPGTALMIRRTVFKKVGGFDEHFFMYFEEQDLCKRIEELGHKLIILPQAKVYHALGSSTKKSNKDIDRIFRESRFYYLKKHFGIWKAFLTEIFLRVNKYTVLLLLIFFLGAFLRLIDIYQTMPFIGDQGWYYLSARNMILTGKIPLVGITSSHLWLHQGALWTYLLAGGFLMVGFSPFTGLYISVFIDLIAILVLYKMCADMFSRQVGLIAALLYATSPLVILNARMPYHTSPIPLVTMLFIYFLYRWVKGAVGFFPLVILTLGILYNLELATFVLLFILPLLLLYGFWKKTVWAKQLLCPKIIFFSLFAFIVAMFPMILYDLTHGFPQTLLFLVWVCYKILVLFGFPKLVHSSSASLSTVLLYGYEGYQQFMFPLNKMIASTIGILSGGYFIGKLYFLFKKKIITTNYVLVGLVTIISIGGFIAAQTPSGAYLPMLFPGLVVVAALFFDKLLYYPYLKIMGLLLIVLVMSFNMYYLITNRFSFNEDKNGFERRLAVAKYIVRQSDGKEYNLRGEGINSQFESFTMNYEYLTWWLGHAPSQEKQLLTFIINEKSTGIKVKKEIKVKR